jgi:transcriptional regulator with XRE-family HTH domain
MNKQQQLIQIRTRKLGLLMADARNSRRRTVEETAQAIGIPTDQLQSIEKGEKAPSLPLLESIAFFLDIPLEQFWGSSLLSDKLKDENFSQNQRLRQLRDRIIGASLRVHRSQQNFSIHELSLATSIPEEYLVKYEQGEISVPLPELEILAKTFDVRLEEFYDQKSAIGKWRAQQMLVREFQALSSDLQDFVSKPVNQPYLQLALKLSELPAEKLRGIAENLLEITF